MELPPLAPFHSQTPSQLSLYEKLARGSVGFESREAGFQRLLKKGTGYSVPSSKTPDFSRQRGSGQSCLSLFSTRRADLARRFVTGADFMERTFSPPSPVYKFGYNQALRVDCGYVKAKRVEGTSFPI